MLGEAPIHNWSWPHT